jgi:hypothetical protein
MSTSQLEAENPRAVTGNNQPPGPIDDARVVYQTLAAFLKDAPVVENEQQALAANEKLAAGRSMVKSLETARDDEAKPLYTAWQDARAKYAPALDSLSKLVGEVSERLKAFMIAEDDRRKREIDEARKVAAEAEKLAREAEAAEVEARENASLGELVDIGEAIEKADEAFDDFKHASRVAKIAEKDATVKFRSRFGAKATTLRSKEVLTLDDAAAAIVEIGVTEKIKEAILSEARAFRKANDRLPAGVSAAKERVL